MLFVHSLLGRAESHRLNPGDHSLQVVLIDPNHELLDPLIMVWVALWLGGILLSM